MITEQKKSCENDLGQNIDFDLAKILTLKRVKLGQNNDFTACIYIYIYAVELLTGPSLAIFKVISWAKSKLLSGPR